MNLLEHYIEKVISVVDVTKEWEKCMHEEDPNFVETDHMLEINPIITKLLRFYTRNYTMVS